MVEIGLSTTHAFAVGSPVGRVFVARTPTFSMFGGARNVLHIGLSTIITVYNSNILLLAISVLLFL